MGGRGRVSARIFAIWKAVWDRGVSISIAFRGLDAGRDRCLAPGCGVQRKLHGRGHRFVEKAP